MGQLAASLDRDLQGPQDDRGDRRPRRPRLRPPRLFPLFRDREELSTASSLGERIERALAASRNLIVICSPNAVGSRWVNEEIRTFKALGREGRVFCLIVDGEPNAADRPGTTLRECFPEAVRFTVRPDRAITTERTEPLAAEPRPDKDDRRNALLKLSAGLLDVGFDSLKQRDQERRIRQFAVAGVLLALLVVVLAGLAYYAFQQKNTAEREARAARAALSGQVASRSDRARRVPATQPAAGGPGVAHHREQGRAVGLGPAAIATSVKDGDQRVLLSPDPRWLVSRGSDEARRLQKQFRPGMTSREDSDLKKALKAVVPVTALVDLGAKDLPASRRVLNRAGEPKAVSPNGRWLVTGGQDVPLLWPLAGAGAPIALKEHTKTLDGAAFSADGRWLLTGGYDGGARLWDLAAKEVATSSRLLTQREFSIGTVAFSPDGRLLLAAGHDQTQLWELGADGTLSPSMALPVDAARVWGATFTPDGRWLVTRSYDTKTLSVWTLALDTLLCLACRTAGRNLTSDEARAYFPGQPAPAPCAAH